MSDIIIDSQFNGPPQSGNGGYCCGAFAAALTTETAGAIEVTLRSPPPLNRPLQHRPSAGGIEIFTQERAIADVRHASLSINYPTPPSLEEAEEASQGYSGFNDHPFPGCFVCGPAREPCDGLRIFPGPVADNSQVAAPWQPFSQLADNNGFLQPEFIWAALDCPSYFGTFIGQHNIPALLGRMTLEILESEIPVNNPLIITAWPIEHSGRKHLGGSALFDQAGKCLALSSGTWIELTA